MAPRSSRARKTEFAIFSGYDMSRQAFIDMVTQMPTLSSQLREPYSMEKLVRAYDRWRGQHRANLIMPLYEGNDGEDKLPKGTYSAVTSFFAPTRYIDYTDESQLEDAEKAPFAQETEKDKTALANFVRCVEDHGGLQLDATKLRFRWIRDYHPHYSISTGTWIAPRRRAHKTEFAIFSGYDMSHQAFADMVTHMPVLSSQLREPHSVEKLVRAYGRWRTQHRANLIMPLYEGNDEDFKPKGAYSAVTSFFMPTRHIDYTDESQLEDGENAPFAQETEKDQAALANWVHCVHDHGGFQLDTTKLRFRWVRDYHPYYSLADGTWSG